MSKSKQKTGRPRRLFSDEYTAEVVALVENGNKSFSQVCKDLGLTNSVVRRWVRSSKDSSLKPISPGVGESVSDELKQLRAENKQLKAERDILKKATHKITHLKMPSTGAMFQGITR